jgi:hypothetical protein
MIPEEYIWELAWARALLLALLELLVPILIGYVVLVVAFFRHREASAGLICTFCAVFCVALPFGILFALAFGWLRAGRWGMRSFLGLWTGLVVLAAADVAAALVLRDLDGATLRRLFGIQY